MRFRLLRRHPLREALLISRGQRHRIRDRADATGRASDPTDNAADRTADRCACCRSCGTSSKACDDHGA
jgi:hypothetical protein